MRVEILRGADRNDPFNQVIYLAAREEIGGKNYAASVAISDNLSSVVSGSEASAYASEVLQMAAKRLAYAFADNLERSILEEMGKATGTRVPMLGEILNKQKKVEPLLPKDILSELEPMEEKRIMENLGVAV